MSEDKQERVATPLKAVKQFFNGVKNEREGVGVFCFVSALLYTVKKYLLNTIFLPLKKAMGSDEGKLSIVLFLLGLALAGGVQVTDAKNQNPKSSKSAVKACLLWKPEVK